MHICNGQGYVPDEEGRELTDDDHARREAIAAARDVMAADLREGMLDLGAYIEVEDEVGRALFTITFADAVTVTTGRHSLKRQKPR